MRVLFVDDDPNILQGLQRLLRSMRHEWHLAFALGPREATTMFENEPFDVIVTDMRMPEMTGAELLARIRDSHPAVARIVLSGHSHLESAVRSAGIAHQFLAKPCDGETLRNTIARVLALRRLLHDENLARLVSSIGSLPSLPTSYARINEELCSDDPSLQRVADIVASDIAMSAKVLQLVNSAFFGLARRVDSITQAVTLLGTDVIKALVVSRAAFSEFDARSTRFSPEHLWRHSLRVGAVAAAIAKSERCDAATVGETLQAGMLHDIGQLILATHLPERYDATLDRAATTLFDAETDTLGANHAHVGAYLLGLWGLPDNTVEAVAFHHEPDSVALASFAPLSAVHAADALVHEADDAADCPERRAATAALESHYSAATIDRWRAIATDTLTGTDSP
jgi:putative nucleotidyltransferase with HDIG domain